MRSWVVRFGSALVVGLSLFGVFSAEASAQVRFAPTESSLQDQNSFRDAVEAILQQGNLLEHERRWGEALAHYEEGLRQHPGDLRLEERFATSKLHYDLARRYSDQSFNRSLATLTEQDALALYSEVLVKIQSHYVDPPNWAALVEHGTRSLGVALRDSIFLERSGRTVSPAQLAKFEQDLQAQLARRGVRDRNTARDAVATAAHVARTQLGLPGTAVVMEYVCGAANALDDYSAYLTADQLNEVYSQIDGNFVGLGIELKAAEGALLIVKVIPGSPAEQARLRPNDSIVSVNGRSTAELSTDEAANLLQGPEGSTVQLAVVTPGQPPRLVAVRRAHVDIPSVTDEAILDPDQGIGYLKLTCFQKSTSRDLDAALWKLHRLGMRSLIIDLRGNPGGLLTSAVEVVDKFVGSGTIVSTRGRNPSEDFNYSAHRANTWTIPLIVLIDGDSASASEIFAGAMRDHRRAVIVGERSYGKGSVQGIFPLNLSRSGLRLTTAKFYSPSGQPFSKVGVSPDVPVHRVAKPVTEGTVALDAAPDPILAEALKLAPRLARR
jgi:carboxyl-terminal processing protease